MEEHTDVKRSQYRRVQNDFYCEPRWADEQLFDAETFNGTVHDPACGSGTIPSVCLSRGITATGSDIVRRCGFGEVADFFTDTTIRDNVVSNVPFRHAEPFLRHALAHTHRKVALILPISFLESQCRDDLYERFPPARVWIFSRRPSMPPGVMDGECDRWGAVIQREGKGGMTPYAWFVWERGDRGETVMKRLPSRRLKLVKATRPRRFSDPPDPSNRPERHARTVRLTVLTLSNKVKPSNSVLDAQNGYTGQAG
jgi:hypothetical protein